MSYAGLRVAALVRFGATFQAPALYRSALPQRHAVVHEDSTYSVATLHQMLGITRCFSETE